MLKRIVEFSVRFHNVVVALAVVAIIYGLWVTAHAKFDVFPEFVPPQVVIQTEAPGLSPKQVEAMVTRPIESAVNGVIDLDAIRSQSIQGFSIITVVFHEGADILDGRQMVNERLVEAASRLPLGLGPPTMAPLTSSTSTVLELGLTPKAVRTSPTSQPTALVSAQTPSSPSLMDLRAFADWTLRPRLLSVHGVAKVVIYGGEVRQTQIQLRPDRLIAYGLGINDVLEAALEATGVRGAGFVQTGPQRVVVRTEGQAPTPRQLGRTLITQHNGVAIRL